jgi:hypothetical protein
MVGIRLEQSLWKSLAVDDFLKLILVCCSCWAAGSNMLGAVHLDPSFCNLLSQFDKRRAHWARRIAVVAGVERCAKQLPARRKPDENR